MPFCHFRLRAEKPPDQAYPRELRTWGDHLRRRRLDLGLRQKDVALQIGADPGSVWAWERNLRTPYVHHIPAIIDFLGYVPYDPAWTAGERLRAVREALGLSQKKLANALGVDEGTVARWERGSGHDAPKKDLLQKIRVLAESLRLRT